MPMKSFKTVTTVALWLSTAVSSSFELTIPFITPLILDTLVVCNVPRAIFWLYCQPGLCFPFNFKQGRRLPYLSSFSLEAGTCSLVLQPKVLSLSSTLLSLLLSCCPCELHSLLLCTVDVHLGVLCSQWPISYLRAESICVEQFVSTRVCSTYS